MLALFAATGAGSSRGNIRNHLSASAREWMDEAERFARSCARMARLQPAGSGAGAIYTAAEAVNRSPRIVRRLE